MADTELPVSVKALEWRRGYCDDQVTILQADTFGGVYQVRILNGVVWLDKPRTQTIYPSIEEAKAAAQAEYEQCILSALATRVSEGQREDEECKTCVGTGTVESQNIGPPDFGFQPCPDCTPVPDAEGHKRGVMSEIPDEVRVSLAKEYVRENFESGEPWSMTIARAILAERNSHASLVEENQRFRAGIKRLSDEEEKLAETTDGEEFSLVSIAAQLAHVEAENRRLTRERDEVRNAALEEAAKLMESKAEEYEEEGRDLRGSDSDRRFCAAIAFRLKARASDIRALTSEQPVDGGKQGEA